MARKLKTYQTSVGFFDLAIAAPSMKAAAEAWGSQVDAFRRGFAKETQDPAEGAFQHAEREHERKVKEIAQDRIVLDERSKVEGARWEKQKRKLESALRRARG